MFVIKYFYSSITEDILIHTIHFAEKNKPIKKWEKKLYSAYENHFFTIKTKTWFKKKLVVTLPWVCIYVYMRVCIYIYIYIYVCVCVCVCVYLDVMWMLVYYIEKPVCWTVMSLFLCRLCLFCFYIYDWVYVLVLWFCFNILLCFVFMFWYMLTCLVCYCVYLCLVHKFILIYFCFNFDVHYINLFLLQSLSDVAHWFFFDLHAQNCAKC